MASGRHPGRGHGQIRLVLPVGPVGHENHPPSPQSGEDLDHTLESKPSRVGIPPEGLANARPLLGPTGGMRDAAVVHAAGLGWCSISASSALKTCRA